MPHSKRHPQTPDGRYFVVGGRLWRVSNPILGVEERSQLVRELMNARRAVLDAKSDSQARKAARTEVDADKRARFALVDGRRSRL